MRRALSILSLAVVLGWSAVAAVPMVQDLDWDCVKPVYVIAGDFDGDGWDDVALACHSCDMILVGLNPGNAPCPVPWPSPKVFPLADSPVALAWGLFGSGVGPYHKEIVGVTQYTPSWTQFKVTDSSASLEKLPLVTAVHVTIGDFDGNGGLDVAVLDPLGLSVAFPSGGIAAIDLGAIASPGEPAFIAQGDFDRDGDLDLVISSGTSLLFFENDRTGGFAFKEAVPVGLSLRAIAVADFDNDGDADLATVDPKFGALAILRNDGCWKFTITARIKMDKGPVFVIPFDCDRDGDIDLAVAEFEGNCVSIATNNGRGSFTIERTLAVGNEPIGLAVGDFDRNAIPDLIVALHGGGPAGQGPAAQVIYNPCCAIDDCTKQAPCCDEGATPPSCGGS